MGGIQAYQTTNPAAANYYEGGPSRVTGADYKTAQDQRTLKQGDFDQNLSNFGTFMNRYFPQTGGGTTASASSTGANGPITQVPGMGTVATWTPSALPPMPSMPSPQSTSDAAFAKAKDQIGGSLQGLTKALGDQFASRGIGDSSLAGGTIANALVKGNGQLAGVATDQAIHNADTANDFAKEQYQGALTGRGQNIGAMEAAANEGLTGRSQNITMRGQDIARNEEAARFQLQQQQDRIASITGLWKAFMGGGSGTPSGLY